MNKVVNININFIGINKIYGCNIFNIDFLFNNRNWKLVWLFVINKYIILY